MMQSSIIAGVASPHTPHSSSQQMSSGLGLPSSPLLGSEASSINSCASYDEKDRQETSASKNELKNDDPQPTSSPDDGIFDNTEDFYTTNAISARERENVVFDATSVDGGIFDLVDEKEMRRSQRRHERKSRSSRRHSTGTEEVNEKKEGKAPRRMSMTSTPRRSRKTVGSNDLPPSPRSGLLKQQKAGSDRRVARTGRRCSFVEGAMVGGPNIELPIPTDASDEMISPRRRTMIDPMRKSNSRLNMLSAGADKASDPLDVNSCQHSSIDQPNVLLSPRRNVMVNPMRRSRSSRNIANQDNSLAVSPSPLRSSRRRASIGSRASSFRKERTDPLKASSSHCPSSQARRYSLGKGRNSRRLSDESRRSVAETVEMSSFGDDDSISDSSPDLQ